MTLQQERTMTPPQRRPWLTALVTVAVLVALGLGAWFLIDATQETDLETATRLADEWVAGWNNNDPDAIAALFTEDGEYGFAPGPGDTGGPWAEYA